MVYFMDNPNSKMDDGWETETSKCTLVDRLLYSTLWLYNIAMENGPFIDGLPGFAY